MGRASCSRGAVDVSWVELILPEKLICFRVVGLNQDGETPLEGLWWTRGDLTTQILVALIACQEFVLPDDFPGSRVDCLNPEG